MVSVWLPSDALSQHLPSYLGFSYLGRGASLHGCSSKAQPLLLTLDEGCLLTAAPPDLERGVAPLALLRPAAAAPCSLDVGKLLSGRGSCAVAAWRSRSLPRAWARARSSRPRFCAVGHSPNYHTIALISHASKVTLKILQARLQQYVKGELPHVQAGFRKGRGTRDQIANIHWIIEKAREFQKNIYFCFIDHVKGFDCVGHNKL